MTQRWRENFLPAVIEHGRGMRAPTGLEQTLPPAEGAVDGTQQPGLYPESVPNGR